MTRPHKTLIFHIGDHKTGSTSIQAAFARNKVTLKNRTIFYPAKLAHNYLKESFKAYSRPQRKAAHKKAIATFENLAGRIETARADFCLISGESFEGVDPAVFHAIVTRYFAEAADDIRVVAYVRPHAARLLSSFCERLKNGNARAMGDTLDTFFTHTSKNRRFHYLPRFSAWRDAFGDQFILRPFVRDQLYQGSVVADFIRHGFAQEDFRIEEVDHANQSLCLEDLMRLKVLQSQHAKHPHKLNHALGWEAARLLGTLPAPQTRTRLGLHKALARNIHSTYLQDARAMDQRFFDAKPLLETELTHAVDHATEAAQSLDPSAWLGAGEMRSLTVLATLIGNMTRADPGKWVAFWRSNLAEGRQPDAASDH